MIAFYGKECVMLQVTDGEGNSRTTSNRRDILERVMRKTLPVEVITRLNELRVEGKHPTLFAALLDLIGQVRASDGEVEEMFSELSDGDPARVKYGLENKPARAKNKKHFE